MSLIEFIFQFMNFAMFTSLNTFIKLLFYIAKICFIPSLQQLQCVFRLSIEAALPDRNLQNIKFAESDPVLYFQCICR